MRLPILRLGIERRGSPAPPAGGLRPSATIAAPPCNTFTCGAGGDCPPARCTCVSDTCVPLGEPGVPGLKRR